ncbi:MAG: hypothetical protein AAF919_10095 [Pseudomonadota bacterium]
MTSWADFAIVASVILLPLAGDTERLNGRVDPWFLPRAVHLPFTFAVVGLFMLGLWSQDFPHPAEASDRSIAPLAQTLTAFVRVFSGN